MRKSSQLTIERSKWSMSALLHAVSSPFFFKDTATSEIYTLSLHDALPIWRKPAVPDMNPGPCPTRRAYAARSEEHTSELQSHSDIVCRLLLEKKNSPLPRGKPQGEVPEMATFYAQVNGKVSGPFDAEKLKS